MTHYQFLRTLDLAQNQYLIATGAKPIAGLVPPWEIESPENSRQALLGRLDAVRARTRDIPEGRVEGAVEAAVQEVRTRRPRPA